MIDNISELIRAVSTIFWPVIVLIVLLFYKTEISNLVARLRKARVFGQEVELDKDLDNLAKSAEQLEEGSRYTENLSPDETARVAGEAATNVERDLLEETARSPKVGLILLGGEIEREARSLAASLKVSGRDKRQRSGPMANSLMRNISVLTEMGVLPPGIFDSLEQFRLVRNEIVHGDRPVADDDILRAIDSGLSILRVLKAVPRFKHVVHASGIKVYSDRDGKKERDDVQAILVESINPGGITSMTRIFPRKKDGLHPGDLVTFEFNVDQSWGPSWYFDEVSGEIKLAWEQAAEFVGDRIDA